MLGLTLDLPGAAVKLYQVFRQDRELQNWIRLVLGCTFSGFISFTGTTGAALAGIRPFVVPHNALVAIGWGLIWCSITVLGVLLRDPRGRTLMISVPQPIVEAYEKGIGGQGPTTINPEKK